MEVETDPQISSNSKVTITLISSLVLLVFLYPWLLAVSTIFFLLGFSCLEHVDKFVKSSISSGRFGAPAQAYFKNYLTLESIFGSHKNVIKEVTADPLSEYLEESQKSAQIQQQHQDLHPVKQGQKLLSASSYPSLSIPARSSSSNKSSPEKVKPLESPRSLSVASSRRVSEDVIPDLIIQHPHRKTPSPSKSSTAASTPSPSITLNPEIVALKPDQDFKVPLRVDNAFGRLCTNILNYYISPSWAPYETRRQLRVCFKQLFTSVGESINRKLICSDTNSLTKLSREKLIPLFLFYADKTLKRGQTSDQEPIISGIGRRRLILKIRKFCRKIFEKFLNRDDRKCKLWMELCIAVLADGVLVNVINLGKDKLPELLEDLITNYKTSRTSGQPPRGNINLQDDITLLSDSHSPAQDYQHSPVPPTFKNHMHRISSVDEKASIDKVPFLLDSFLDPPYNLDKPDIIVSRWRPTLKDIVSETDLLYPLIQFMKHVGGQQSLAYLQGVLDDFPGDGDPYCRRMLELEYLPGFCRSSLLLETMGLSRVEMAMEVGVDPMSRRNSSTWQAGHGRSASYGGPTNSFREFLKIEQGIVDGLPLTESGSYQNSTPVAEQPQTGGGGGGVSVPSATLPGAGAIEPNLAFKRRPHLEMYIAKFLKSTTKSWKQYYDPLGTDNFEPAKREGNDAKSYEEWDHPDVNTRVRVEATTSDIYDELFDLVSSSMRNCPIASPFVSGFANFLKPYLMPLFENQLDQNLSDILSVDLLVYVVDLIANVFEESSDDGFTSENGESQDAFTLPSAHSSPGNTTQEDKDSHHHHASCTTCDQINKSSIKSFLTYLLDSFIVKMIDLDYFVKSCRKNRDYIFLFFVDVLDVLVREIVEE